MTDSLQQEISTLRSLFWSPRDPEGHAFAPLADAYRRAGDFRLAVEVLRDGMDRHPDFLPGHVVAAQLYLEKGLLEEAELASRRAVALDAENEVARELLADVLAEKGDGGAEVTEPAPEPEPDAETAFEPALELSELAPEPEPEPVLELSELAPEPEPEPVLELSELAPEPEPEPEPQAEAAFEPVMEFSDLAPEPEPEPQAEAAFEPVVELSDLAPEPEPEPEPRVEAAFEPVVEFSDLAPEPEPEPVVEFSDLAPEPEPEPVVEFSDLAPEPEPEPEPEPRVEAAFEPEPEPEPVVEFSDLAPEPEPEPVVEFSDLAPEPEPEPEPEPQAEAAFEPVVELAALAPDEPIFDMGMLAPSERPPLDEDELPADDFADGTPLVTRTMGDLYLRQGLTERALEVFRQLLEVSPGDRALRARVEELSGLSAPAEHDLEAHPTAAAADDEDDAAGHHWTSGGLEARHDVDTPFAWTQEEEPASEPAPETPPVGDYFRRMLGWAPGGAPDGVEGDSRDDA